MTSAAARGSELRRVFGAEQVLGQISGPPYVSTHDVRADRSGTRPDGRRSDGARPAHPGRDHRLHGRRWHEPEEICQDLPDLTPEDVAEALRYVAETMRERTLPLFGTDNR